jgi:hypothetical protein
LSVTLEESKDRGASLLEGLRYGYMLEEYENVISGIVKVSKWMEWRSYMVSPVLRQQTSWWRSLKIIAVIAMLSLAGTPVTAADKSLVRFLAPVNEDGSISYSTSGNVDLFLSFIGTSMPPDDPNRMELYVTPFAGEQGDNISVTPFIAELSDVKPENQRLIFLLDRPVMTLQLKVPELPTAGKYVGHIVITKKDKEPQINRIVLTQPTAQPPARLSIDTRPNIIYHTQSLVKKWIWPRNPPTFTVFALNSEPEWQARGVFLCLLEAKTPEGANFDPQKNLTFTWNGQKADDLWRAPSPQDTNEVPYVIPPNNQAEIGGEFHNLVPGEYTIKLGLAATNVAPQAESQMTVTVWVRHSIVGAIVVLLLAIAISFIATKGLEGLRRRIAVLKRTSELKLPFLREDTAPNVSIRAMLKQVEDCNKSWFDALFGPDVVSDRVDKAAQMIGILRRVYQIRDHISNWDEHIMVKYRVEKHLREITADMTPETVNKEYATESKRKLDELEKWITTDEQGLCTLYWEDVKSRTQRLLC